MLAAILQATRLSPPSNLPPPTHTCSLSPSQTGWKLSAPYTSWSEAHGSTVTNLLWAVGPSPFGPYSSQIQLSFALRDSAIRSGVHALAADLLGELASLRSYFREWGKEVDDVLGARDHLSFLRRLNVFSFKLQVRKHLT